MASTTDHERRAETPARHSSPGASSPGTSSRGTVRAWDVPTRLFHWSLVMLVFTSWATFTYSEWLSDPTLTYHRYSGYTILILVTWRLIWGVIGPDTVRFTSFVRGPVRAVSFARKFLTRDDPHYLGHNPVVAYAVLLMLALLAGQTVLGLLSEEHNGTTWGPLFFLVENDDTRAWLTELHGTLFYYGILAIVGIHVLAAFFHDTVRREGITKAMVTGKKPAKDYIDGRGIVESPAAIAIRAMIALAVATALVFGTIKLLGGKLFY